jgi:phospholipase C
VSRDSIWKALGIASLMLALSACSAGGSGGGAGFGPPFDVRSIEGPPAPHVHRHTTSSPIKHVVIVVQENRSFNNLLYGFPGATTQDYGYTHTGEKVTLGQIGLATTWDLEHDSTGFFDACNGTGSIPGTDCQMNGFDKEYTGCGGCHFPEYNYVPHNETKPYFDIGKQYAVADQMYASNFDASSFISHQYIIAAQAEGSVNFPASDWGCPGGSGDIIDIVGPDRQIPYGYQPACYDDDSIGEEADNADVSWAFYTSTVYGDGGIWSAYQANQYVYYGSDWKNDVLTPQKQFFTDVSNGSLRDISWVTPTCENSDHAGCDSDTGPSWVASLVNAIGESQYWDNTVMFIFWDDYGGWYDPEPPAYADYDGLGMRIPMLIVSAYAKKHYVSEVHYEHGSILKFVENLFGLPRLSASDTRANSPTDCFDFSKPPRTFTKIQAKYSRYYIMHQPPDLRPPDTN